MLIILFCKFDERKLLLYNLKVFYSRSESFLVPIEKVWSNERASCQITWKSIDIQLGFQSITGALQDNTENQTLRIFQQVRKSPGK